MAQMQMLMQRPAYMEALEGLSAAGLMLVEQLKEAGRQVRLKDEEMRREGGKVARRLEEELRQLKAHHTTSLQSIVDRLAASASPSPPQVRVAPRPSPPAGALATCPCSVAKTLTTATRVHNQGPAGGVR
jgi:hypothetical protein